MPIRTRRWNDPKEPGDGLRVLVSRYRPRALKKSDETWDVWWSDLGPSKELHADFYGKHGEPIGHAAYVKRYLVEMRSAKAKWLIADLARRVNDGETITLLCSSACTDANNCHRTLLTKMIEDEMKRVRASAK
jgi:uncharacterized protein YeaO (DUF488 family)